MGGARLFFALLSSALQAVLQRRAAGIASERERSAHPGRGEIVMPTNWEYVLAAYGIWGAVFTAYIIRLAWRTRAVSRTLRRLEQAAMEPERRP
jgi:hypothetical protein